MPVMLASTTLSTAAAGFLLSLSLIAAIGAQNLFVLRQGLRGQHVLLCVLFCASADAVLAALGVTGMAQLLAQLPWFSLLLAAAGAVFLLVYGGLALRRAWRGGMAATVTDEHRNRNTWLLVLAQLAALTLLNPHVYLDTVVLIGSMGAQQPGPLRWFFVLGTSAASLFWFASLGFGARWLRPWFARQSAWRALDVLTGCTMLVLAVGLIQGMRAAL